MYKPEVPKALCLSLQSLAVRYPLLSGVYRLLRTSMQIAEQCGVFDDDTDSQVRRWRYNLYPIPSTLSW